MKLENKTKLLIVSTNKKNICSLYQQLRADTDFTCELIECTKSNEFQPDEDVKLLLLHQPEQVLPIWTEQLKLDKKTTHLPLVLLTERLESLNIDKILSCGVADIIEVSSCFSLTKQRLRNCLNMAVKNNKQTQPLEDQILSLCQLIRYTCHEVASPIGNTGTTISYLQEVTGEISKKMAEKTLLASDLTHYFKQQETAFEMCVRNIGRANKVMKSFWSVTTAQCYNELCKVNLHVFVEDIVTTLHSRLKKLPFTIDTEIPELIEITTYKGSFAQLTIALLEYSIVGCLAGNPSGNISIKIALDGSDIVMTFHNQGDTVFSQEMDIKAMIDSSKDNIATRSSMSQLQEMVSIKLGGELTFLLNGGDGKDEKPQHNICQIRLPKEIQPLS